MGFYINHPEMPSRGKADWLLAKHEGMFTEVGLFEAEPSVSSDVEAIIVVVDNGNFEAAAFAYNDAEFNAFTDRGDLRPKRYLRGDRETIEKMANFPDRSTAAYARFMGHDRYNPTRSMDEQL